MLVSLINHLVSKNNIPDDIALELCEALSSGRFLSVAGMEGLSSINKDESFAIAKLCSLLINCDKYTCVSSAKIAIRFLTHKSDLVKQLAAFVLCFLIKIATLALINEKNPAMIRELSGGLQEVISELSDLMDEQKIPKNIALKIVEAIKFVNLGMLGSELDSNKIKYSDEFVSSAVQGSIKRLIGNLNVDNFKKTSKEV